MSAKPILKNAADGSSEAPRAKRKKKARAKIVWDEDNLKYNEENKSATMKIDEPPTPANLDFRYDEEVGEDRPLPTEAQVSKEHWEVLHDKVLKLQERKDDAGDEHWTPELEEELVEAQRRRDFEKKRKEHYNEFEMVKKMREKAKRKKQRRRGAAAAADSDDEEDSDDE